MKKLVFLFIFLFILGLLAFFLVSPFLAPGKSSKIETFVVPQNNQEVFVVQDLEKKGLIKAGWAMDLVLTLKGKHDKISAGGYYLSKDMHVLAVVDKITGPPDLKWITFPEGLRKEQIGERLQKLLGWSSKQLDDWNNTYTAMKFDDIEGVYFPDTCLLY